MINVAISYPSETPGCVLDVKKGRSTISFTHAELHFISDLFDTILATENAPSYTRSTPIIDVEAEVIDEGA